MGGDGVALDGGSERVRQVVEWFSLKAGRCWQAEGEGVFPELGEGRVVLVTGASGAGKSRWLARFREHLAAARPGLRQIDLQRVRLPGRAVVDCLAGGRLEEALEVLSRVGLAEAWDYLRRPSELSEGQRFRLRWAVGLWRAGREGKRNRRKGEAAKGRGAGREVGSNGRKGEEPKGRGEGGEVGSNGRMGEWVNGRGEEGNVEHRTSNAERRNEAGTVLVCDEFCAVLDRVTARVVARTVRRAVTAGAGVCAVVATSHGDLGEALLPDVVVECDFGRVEIRERCSGGDEVTSSHRRSAAAK